MGIEIREEDMDLSTEDKEIFMDKELLFPRDIIGFLCWRYMKDSSIWNSIFEEAGITSKKNKDIANRILTNLISNPERLTYLRHEKNFRKGNYYYYEGVGKRCKQFFPISGIK